MARISKARKHNSYKVRSSFLNGHALKPLKKTLPLHIVNKDDISLITGTANPRLAENIGKLLRVSVDNQAVTVYADKEPQIKIKEILRNKHVFIIQSTSPPDINRAVIELTLLADASRRASADEITAVIPYYGFARSDRKDQPRVPIAAAVIAKMLKVSGVDRIVTLDIHAEQAQGFFDGPWDNLFASSILFSEFKKSVNPTEPIVIVAPDTGASRKAEKLSRLFLVSSDVATIYKMRPKVNEAHVLGIMGNVENKTALLVDDMVDTGGSLIKGAIKLRENGAKHIYALATHGLFSELPEKSKYPLQQLQDSPIEKVFITDTISHRLQVQKHPKIQIVSIAPMLAETIKRIHTGEALSELIQK